MGANVAATDLQPGDQLLAARLVPKEQVSEDVTDKVQISALLDAERAVGGSLRRVIWSASTSRSIRSSSTTAGRADRGGDDRRCERGDRDSTDATVHDRAPKKSPNMTRLEFQHVLVTNVQTTNAPVSRRRGRRRRRTASRR